jgi:pimeloyl-ACP methyl ester carboxylesterase
MPRGGQRRMSEIVALATGAEARITNPGAQLAAILVNGGTAKRVAGTWSATSELLTTELAPRFPEVSFVEVRYRLKTWKELAACYEDATAAIELLRAAGVDECLLVGFSMGGTVSIGVAAEDSVTGVLGLAPWIPARLPVEALRGRRFDVVHGSWDRYLPGVPGVSPGSSRAGFDRIRALGVEGTYTLIPGGVHGCAVRARSGRLVRLPRWRGWVEQVGLGLERFQASASLRRSS